MVNVVSFYAPAMPSHTATDISRFLEGKIAQITLYGLVATTGALATEVIDANGRLSPVPGGTTVAVGHIRLADWQSITLGSDHAPVVGIQLTVLYLKDAPGKYP